MDSRGLERRKPIRSSRSSELSGSSNQNIKSVRPSRWYLSTGFILAISIIERILIFFWGLYQDATMPLRFTDIDYFVFTDAARFMAAGYSPYMRETYRYTPLLAWILIPCVQWFFSFGKVLFAIGDIVAGILILRLFGIMGVPERQAVLYSSVWLLNPMVSAISTRGSSEGLLGAIVISAVWAVYSKRYLLGGLIAGFAVHFKIYPVIYIPTIIWALEHPSEKGPTSLVKKAVSFFNRDRLVFGGSAFVSFTALTSLMYYMYGYEFLLHTYLHHLSRIDHRHNFSPYSTFLYMSWSPAGEQVATSLIGSHELHGIRTLATWAFIPQLLLSGIVLPLAFAKKSIVKTMFLQTWAFVTFNKVCTSQYFMWYMVLLPFYLPSLSLLRKEKRFLSISAVVLWLAAQAAWIRKGYLLEFLNMSTFYPDLFLATLFFFMVNCWMLGLFINDI